MQECKGMPRTPSAGGAFPPAYATVRDEQVPTGVLGMVVVAMAAALTVIGDRPLRMFCTRGAAAWRW